MIFFPAQTKKTGGAAAGEGLHMAKLAVRVKS